MVILGIRHSSGSYNNCNYDNYYLHCLCDDDKSDANSIGQLTEVLKVPKSLYDNLSISVGDTVNPAYNKFGKLISL